MKRVLLVSDTTCRLNWGGRAASLALQQHLANSFEDFHTLDGNLLEDPHIIDTTLPLSVAQPLLARREKFAVLRAYYALERALGMKADYIELDPVKSARNIIRNRDQKRIGEIFDAVEVADVVIVDGDGDLIFRTPAARIPLFNLAIIELASQLGKEVHYINSIFADCPVTGRNESFFAFARKTLAKCKTIALRDHDSMRLARVAAPELAVQYTPDSLFLWFNALQHVEQNLPRNGDFIIPYPREQVDFYGRLDFDSPYICISGSSHAAFHPEEAIESYTKLACTARDHYKMKVYLAPACRGDRFMYEVARRSSLPIIPTEVPILMGAAILANAQAYISGRYHPAIMASLGGTPCVFLGADSHKTRSLQDLLEYKAPEIFPSLPNTADCRAIVQAVEEKIHQGDELRAAIRNTAMKRAREAERITELIIGGISKPADQTVTTYA